MLILHLLCVCVCNEDWQDKVGTSEHSLVAKKYQNLMNKAGMKMKVQAKN